MNADLAFPYRQAYSVVYAASKTALNAVTLAFAIGPRADQHQSQRGESGPHENGHEQLRGTDTVEQGTQDMVRVVLDVGGPTGTFTGRGGPLPW